ncbi:hypothetical protein HK100_001557 [Physocladia obscura]|uniref:F-box domain-containing protein n=1 Tax=Physocladia obscura TaxID=109957 RepID=A0AAD5SWN7_9FUNG|nr:hypothetical protein HK100_001557 [Physocladia obscura]
MQFDLAQLPTALQQSIRKSAHASSDSSSPQFSISDIAHDHIQSALRLRAALLHDVGGRGGHGHAHGRDRNHAAVGLLDQTIGVLYGYLRANVHVNVNAANVNVDLRRRLASLALSNSNSSFSFDSSVSALSAVRTLPDLPHELVEQILAWIHPAAVLRLRRLSRAVNNMLLAPHFAKLSLGNFLHPSNYNDGNGVVCGGNNTPQTLRLRHQQMASQLDVLFFHWPPSYQMYYISAYIGAKTSIEWSHWPLAASIPACIANLTRLVSLDLSYCNLVGEIPSSLFSLTSLESLKLYENSLHGALSDEIGNLVNLRVLNLHSNGLCGRLPAALAKLSLLTYLNLGYNRFCGAIPRELGSLLMLRNLCLSDNRLTGSVPEEFGFLVVLQYLFLQNNLLVGDIPASVARLPGLIACEMKGNQGLTCSFEHDPMVLEF